MAAQRVFIWVLGGFIVGLCVSSFAGFRVFIPLLLKGSWVTIQVAVLAAVVAILMALIAGLAKLYGPWPVRWLAIAYIETFRGSSALVQLFWLFFVLPHFGIYLSPMEVGVSALGLNTGAYGAEIVRGAILAVPKSQFEACKALNMNRSAMMQKIILPQAFLIMLPPWGNLFIELLKVTALVSLITLSDITFMAYQLNQTTLRTGEIFSITLAMYLCISLLITFGIHALERRASGSLARGRGL